MDLRGKFALVFASSGGIGFIPIAPGTFGSIPGLALYWLLIRFLPMPAVLAVIAAIALLGVWAAGQAEARLQADDPGAVVIDEVVGMMAALYALPVTPGVWIAAFFLFRFFDILKPFPIGYLEKVCPGGIGIMIDDVAAGLAVNLLLRGILYLGVLGIGF